MRLIPLISPKGIGIYSMKYFFVNVAQGVQPKNKAVEAMNQLVHSFDQIVIEEAEVDSLTKYWDKRMKAINQLYKRCGEMTGGRSKWSNSYHYCESFSVAFHEVKQEIPEIRGEKPMEFQPACAIQLSLF